jgi:hypothetical protein
LTPIAAVEISPFLQQNEWSDSTVEIITGLLLRMKVLPDDWVAQCNLSVRSIEHATIVLSTIADRFKARALGNGESLKPALKRLINSAIKENASSTRERCSYAIRALARHSQTLRDSAQKRILEVMKTISPDVLALETLSLGEVLGDEVLKELVDLGLQWAARNLDSTAGGLKDTEMVGAISKHIIILFTLSFILPQSSYLDAPNRMPLRLKAM